jgi:hypothetical protein
MLRVMEAVRCLQCGATRWTLSHASLLRLLEESCEACGGGPTVLERRRPGASPRGPLIERRHSEDEPVAGGARPLVGA